MKRLMMTIVIMAVVIVLTNSSAEAQFAYLRNPDRYIKHGYGYSYRSVLGRSSWTNWSLGNNSFGRYSGYGRNVRVKYNERWDVQGGQRSYEQSPDLTGKIIDGAITLGALAIISK